MAARGRDGIGEFAVVGQQDQSFAVIIEAAHRINPRP